MPARFSYIDAKGKEVEIGGTAQLMQRIRLGAIDGATQLYDAAGDRWAPAGEHPIYQELAAAVEAETPAAGSPGPESPEAPPAPSEEPAAPEPEAPPAEPPPQESEAPAEPAETSEPPEAAEPAEPAEADEADEADEEGGFEEMDFGLTLSGEEGSADVEAEEAEEAEEALEDDRPDPFEMEMGPAAGASEEEEAEPDEEASLEFGDEPLAAEAPAGEESDEGAEEGADEEEASFDFGSEPLELEETEEEEEEEPEEAAEASAAGEGGMDLESPLDHLGVEDDEDSEGSGGFEEGSLVAGAADEDWARSDEEDSWEPEPEEAESEEPEEPEPAGRSGPAGDRGASAEGGGASTEPPREKRAHPPRPPSRKSSSWGSWLTLFLLLAVLAGGGWAGYTFLLGGGGDSAEAQGPGPAPWATRTVPPELRGPAASVRDEAASRASAWIQQLAEAQEIPDRPPQEWLDGIYLAHASEYSEVEAYFSGLQSLVREVRSQAPQQFLDEYQAALAGTDLQEGQRTRLRGWMQEDLEWSQFQRDSVYLLLEAVIGSSLDLHALLVEREGDIRYELMDAEPSSDALQSQIDGHLDRLTGALDQLDALGQVSTTRVVEILQQNLQESIRPDAAAVPAGGAGQPQGNS